MSSDPSPQTTPTDNESRLAFNEDWAATVLGLVLVGLVLVGAIPAGLVP
ncbi:hypothetical protein OG777_01825 [Micromonospora peucetia]|uniref:Uncharacterized protein n=1 Tax=Micromonospora peucetia TaxID=47871 RepID=A0A1C6W670_9ACTN|nr:hypothetical protein [Micromonospora peucetia]MCX4385669.1 hypothetical protein [Micromonospora peucetia]WSA33048.1 hypothetical protein OIE14_02930 [Micromonospora peucetia]SCL74065.1 hypothetical protein GA0070608_6387 [Micromonospora peucetia]